MGRQTLSKSIDSTVVFVNTVKKLRSSTSDFLIDPNKTKSLHVGSNRVETGVRP